MGFKQSYRPNTRKIYEDHFGLSVPEGYEVHHILPLRLGGDHSPSNLIPLTVNEHIEAHLELYRIFGDFRDLCAAAMIGSNFTEAALINASNGGKAAAKAFKDRGQKQGFQAFDPEYQKAVASMGGKIGGLKQKKLRLGIHAQTKEERLALSSMGGKKGCMVNGWLDPITQSENGKKGGPKNKGFKWYTDGISQFKYTKIQQDKLSFKEFLKMNTQYKSGRKTEPQP